MTMMKWSGGTREGEQGGRVNLQRVRCLFIKLTEGRIWDELGLSESGQNHRASKGRMSIRDVA